MHERLVVKGSVTLLMAVMVALAMSGCTKSAVDDAIERSTAPLLVPQGDWRDEFEFTAPPGSTDLYQLQWNFRPGRTDLVAGWQIALTSDYDETTFSEGPGQQIVDEVLRAARGEQCVLVDGGLDLQLCTYEAEFTRGGARTYLVRLIENHILVLEYLNIEGDNLQFSPDALETRFISADFVAMPIDDAADEFLVYIY